MKARGLPGKLREALRDLTMSRDLNRQLHECVAKLRAECDRHIEAVRAAKAKAVAAEQARVLLARKVKTQKAVIRNLKADLRAARGMAEVLHAV